MSLSEGESGNRRGRQRLLYLILVGMGHMNCRKELHLALDARLAFTYFVYLLKPLVVRVN